MTSAERRTGICLVRVELQSDHTLLTLRLVPDIERSATVETFVTSDIGSAVRTVRAFLQDFEADRQKTDETHPPLGPASS
ncbi:hypothetical protein [Streptomyces sp. NPDC059010]|uniref:hypothetical protein n=1 Tax=Streptomyces sp. NPDC059010 TaxID=3346695 RepID=UPI0036BEB134